MATGALHEPISQQGPGWIADWRDGEGVSDAGAAYYLPFILDKVRPKTLIIERPKSEVVESYRRYFAGVAINWSVVHAMLDKALLGLAVDHPLIRRVDYHALADLSVVEDCISWLDAPKPPNLAQLAHFRVESDRDWNLNFLAKAREALGEFTHP